MASKLFPTDFPAAVSVALTDVVLVDDGTSNLKATIQQISDAIGAGDFVGPDSASNNAIVRFDGTTGKLGQNSVVTITDVGAIAGVTTINGNDATTLVVDADIGVSVQAYDANLKPLGVTAATAQQVDQAETPTASATATTLGTTLKHLITGTTTITSFAGVAGVTYHCTAGGAFLLTHHATNLDILQTGANITTAADDTFDVYMRTATTAEIRNYQRASGESLVGGGGSAIGTPVATTSGTAIDFTSIPAGTKQIVISLNNVSQVGTDSMIVQIGDSGGIETSGYVGAISNQSAAQAFSSGFNLSNGTGASEVTGGSVILTLLDSTNFVWACNIGVGTTAGFGGGGVKTLTGQLDRVRLTSVSATAFDAGSVNIFYQ